ncbi:SMEK domain-containing protein [Sphingobacterium sp.]|uniref:SMEK domain-containing protein n=1 Tax=Sphingobacterium sp. TaxID=341027 RepID=UPI0031E126A9
MSKTKDLKNRINVLLSRWLAEVQGANAISYYDINIISEGISMRLLNLVYGYDLSDLNKEIRNYPGIDLGDTISGIAFQVTTQLDSSKIRSSLEKFYGNGLNSIYQNGLKMFLLTYRPYKTKKIKGFEDRFDPNSSIINLKDLVQKIDHLYTEDYSKFLEISDLLEQEFAEQVSPNSTKGLLQFESAKQRINFYTSIYRIIHEESCSDLVPYSCIFNDEVIESEKLINGEISWNRLVFIGGSGLGKSVLSKTIGLESIYRSLIPVFIEAKYYENGLEELIYNEVKVASFGSAKAFIKDCQKENHEIVLIVDGLNECSSLIIPKLLGELSEINKQFKVKIITSQQHQGNYLLNADLVTFSPPSLETKKAIAEKFCNLTDRMSLLLNAATTCLEAKIIGQIGITADDESGQFDLIDRFVREKVSNESSCISLLSIIAGYLSEKITYSISSRELNRLLYSKNLDSKILNQCLESGLLESRLEKYSFSHEKFLDFFIAENIIRSESEASEIIAKLKHPQNKTKQLLILGAIDDSIVLTNVLSSLESTDLICNVLNGECGLFASKWAQNRLAAVVEKIRRESEIIQFEFSGEEHFPIIANQNHLLEWSSQELCLVDAIPYIITTGILFEEIFQIVRVMDLSCERSWSIMIEDAKKNKISLRSAIYTCVYGPFNGNDIKRPVLNRVFSILFTGFARLKPQEKISKARLDLALKKKTLKNGEFLFLLLLFRYGEEIQILNGYMLNAIENHWSSIPYHLKVQILEKLNLAVHNENQRQRAVDGLNKIIDQEQNPFMSSLILESISDLGGLESDLDEYEISVSNRLKILLDNYDYQEAKNEVLNIYESQFDHPFSYAYSLAISKLSRRQTSIFFKMALGGNGECLFENPLILESANVLKSECCNYLLKFLNTPIPNKLFRQDGLCSFLLSNIILGFYNFDRKKNDYFNKSKIDIQLHAYGEVLYWLNRNDMSVETRMENCHDSIHVLFDPDSAYLIETLWQTEFALRNIDCNKIPNFSFVRITEHFKDKIAEAARNSLKSPGLQKAVLSYENEEEIMLHSIFFLKHYGNENDIEYLHPHISHHYYGTAAVEAIKNLR